MHSCTQTHGNLLKWNTQSLTFYEHLSLFLWQDENSERMKSSSTWLLCYRSPLFTVRWLTEEKTGGGGGGGAVFWTEHIHCLSVSILVCQNGTEKETREAEKQRERHRLQSVKWKEAGMALSSPTTMHIRNGCRRRKTMQILLCAGLLSNFRVGGEGREGVKEGDRNTDEEGDLDIPRGLVKSHLQSAVNN